MRPIVALDLDGLLASWKHGTFHRIGPPIAGAPEWTCRLAERYDLLVHSCRTNVQLYPDIPLDAIVDDIEHWLDYYGFSWRGVWQGPGKPLAHAYVDDRAVECVPEERGPEVEFAQATQRIDQLCAREIGTDIPNLEHEEK